MNGVVRADSETVPHRENDHLQPHTAWARRKSHRLPFPRAANTEHAAGQGRRCPGGGRG